MTKEDRRELFYIPREELIELLSVPNEESPIYIPLNFRVLVAIFPKQEQTSGGIYIPETSDYMRLKSTIGRVLKMGSTAGFDQAHSDTGKLKIGDYIHFAPFSGTAVKYDGYDCRLIADDNVMGFLPDYTKLKSALNSGE